MVRKRRCHRGPPPIVRLLLLASLGAVCLEAFSPRCSQGVWREQDVGVRLVRIRASGDVDIEEEMSQVEDLAMDRPAGGEGSTREKVKVRVLDASNLNSLPLGKRGRCEREREGRRERGLRGGRLEGGGEEGSPSV